MANFDKWQDDFNKCVRPDPFEITPWSQSLKFPAFFSWPNPKHICGLHNHPLEALLNKVDEFESCPNTFWLHGQQHGIRNEQFENFVLKILRNYRSLKHKKQIWHSHSSSGCTFMSKQYTIVCPQVEISQILLAYVRLISKSAFLQGRVVPLYEKQKSKWLL